MSFRKQITKSIFLTALLILILGLTGCSGDPKTELLNSLEKGNYQNVATIYNSKILGVKTEAEINKLLQEEITALVEQWDSSEISVETAQDALKSLSGLEKDSLALFASEKYDLVTIEGIGRNLHTEAEEHYANDELAEAMNCVLQIDERYSQYKLAKELYTTSEKIILETVSMPYSREDCINFSKQLDDCLKVVENEKFSKRKTELEKQIEEYGEAERIVETAAALFDEGLYKECFETISAGLKLYPDNNLLSLALENSHNLYVIDVTQMALELCEKKEYKEALKKVDETIEIYDCEAFDELKKSIRKQKNLIYGVLSNVVDKFKAFTQDAEGETLTVKEMGNKVGSYVVKSGKKLLLGDYTEEEITVLSFSGDMVASLAGIDTMLDLRDMSYDLTHWGEGEYFMARLAVDTVALIPVIGAVKYFDLKTVEKTVDAFKKVDTVSDSVKNAGKVADVADSIVDTNKSYKNIGEAVDNVKEMTVFSQVKNKYVRYVSVPTVNARYAGKVHPAGVKFEQKKLDYSDGRKIVATFPEFDHIYEVKLDQKLLKESRETHFKYCNEELCEAIKRNPKLKTKFTTEQLEELEKGITSGAPAGLTWHHNEKEGILQLVDAETHAKVGHTGGYATWGAGSMKDAA